MANPFAGSGPLFLYFFFQYTRIGLAMSTLLRSAARAKAQDAASGGVFHSMGLLWVLNESGPMRANLLAEAVHADPSAEVHTTTS